MVVKTTFHLQEEKWVQMISLVVLHSDDIKPVWDYKIIVLRPGLN